MNEELIFICCGSAIITAIIMSICICAYMSTKYNDLKEQLQNEKYKNIKNENYQIITLLKNIEKLLDPMPAYCYIDNLCYDVASYCIRQKPDITISALTIVEEFQIGFTRASKIIEQLIKHNICKKVDDNGIIAIITMEELQNMARWGQI